MLRPPVDDLLPLEQLEDWTHRSGTWSSTLESSAIMSGVWEATDGNTAVVLFNISDAEQDYEYELSSDDYDVLINGADLYNLTIDGSKSYIDDVNSVFTLSDTLESGEVKVFLLE
jgi:hypothetical protein